MAMRNSWIDVSVDGRATNLSGGPKSKDGKMTARFSLREDGDSVQVATVETGYDATSDISYIIIRDENGNVVFTTNKKY